MKFSAPSIILIEPQLGENIGSTSRAMLNFGVSDLRLVNPRDGWPNYKARMTSVGAYDMLQKVKVYKNTLESIENFDLPVLVSSNKTLFKSQSIF